MVCYIYLKTSIEMNALLDRRIHSNNEERLAQVTRQKRYLHIGTAVAVVLSLGDTALNYTYWGLSMHDVNPYWLYWSF